LPSKKKKKGAKTAETLKICAGISASPLFPAIVSREFRPPKPDPAPIFAAISLIFGEKTPKSTEINAKSTEIDAKSAENGEKKAENGEKKAENAEKRVVFIGDGLDDVIAGNAAGCITIFLENTEKTAENTEKTAENGPKTAENGPKMAENGPKTAENGPKMAENEEKRRKDEEKVHKRAEKSAQLAHFVAGNLTEIWDAISAAKNQ
jgi:hypothetical protein